MRNFIRDLERYCNLPVEDLPRTAESVLCALEQRLTVEEAHDMESQLPANLQDLLVRCDRHAGLKKRSFDLEALYTMVGDDLNLRAGDVPPVVRAVFRAVKDQISEGESQDVASQLPADIREIWWNA